ncbi:1-acyl-sn-glycerol-3-phosphate acyltransferase [Neokomagataea thailandica NBRC 106555]|uniref:1-acyl-sn-glycerol-3-phosphate acyltransferase n=2 Tax=Neokomagataea TaxID=1223423 RepID=A0A4Y6V682_9PROT|nr:lysophospholipid acyltransferase family protein [Neokomagataea tanensis]QDH24076.1 1-acyl-sn-glycerol-3-phosphate acyltransferase [Neokomagataea tanensis]GBR50321.1 1-acyl-sn-glycerol-3-phosphate acyltransferase [Neokomagataea thailandica NBRC 106555]
MLSFMRGSAFNLYLFWLTLIMGIGALPIRCFKNEALALGYARLWAKAVLRGLCFICNIRIVIEGKEHLTTGAPLLIASQHQSFFDGFIWMSLAEKPAYIIKQELTRIPLVGPMLLLSGMIPVERSAGSSAMRGMLKAVSHAHNNNRQVIIFPEGTRTDPGERHPIQPGIVALARQSEAPVLPVATNSGRYWPKNPWQKMSGTIIVAIGPQIMASTDRKAFLPKLEQGWDDLCKTYNLS